MSDEIIHTAIWAGRMFVLVASVLRVRLESVCNHLLIRRALFKNPFALSLSKCVRIFVLRQADETTGGTTSHPTKQP